MRADGELAGEAEPGTGGGPVRGDPADAGSGAQEPAGPPKTVDRLLATGLELPEQGTGARAARREGRARAPDAVARTREEAPGDAAPATPRPRGASAQTMDPRWRAARPYLYVAALLALVASGVALGIGGYRVVRDSTEGKTVDPTLEPDQPGYEAFVEPSPTMLVLGRAADGAMGWAALLAAPAAEPGAATSVVVVPGGLLVPVPPAEVRLDALFAEQGSLAVRSALAQRLGLGIAEVVEIDDRQLADLVGPAGTLEVPNSDRAEGFASGDLRLDPAEVGPFLAAPGRGDDGERSVRQERVWRAWAVALAAAPPAEAPTTGGVAASTAEAGAADGGAGGPGIAAFVAGLGHSAARVDVLPVAPALDTAGTTSFALDQPSASAVLSRAVPLPTAASPGGRTRLRVLDASGNPDLPSLAAPRLAAFGGEIVIVGNATLLDRSETLVLYHDRAFAGAAKLLSEVLGVGRTAGESRPSETYDVTVLLGTDAVESLRSPAGGPTISEARSETTG